MYLWQYWRDTRRGVYIYLGALFLYALIWVPGMIHFNRIHHVFGSRKDLWGAALSMTFAATLLCVVIMPFVLGNNNVGSEIGKGTGDFLLTRPRPRRYFVWTGWAAGMAELLAVMAITALVALGSMTLVIGPALWRQARWTDRPFPQVPTMSVPLAALSLVLTAATIFGLTYFLTVLFKSAGRGVKVSFVILYASATVLLLGAGIPPLGSHFARQAGALVSWYLAPRVEIPFLTILALAFPLAAQVALSRSDI